MLDLTTAEWRTSTRCDLNGCVEVALLEDRIAVRNSTHKAGPVLLFTPAEWSAFLGGVREGEFDLP